ncbi:tetratricopeptide repeat protein [Thermodesulfobacteriota bacterium]
MDEKGFDVEHNELKITAGRALRNTLVGKKKEIIICAFLIVVTATLYWQVRHHDFTLFDDPAYVTENPYVQKGLHGESVLWAFSFKHKETTYWHPLTWLSHMLDCHLFGLDAGAHHLTNLIFHIANSLLLFFMLRKATGDVWPSAFVAALFALHPMNVDTVAWVTERKNVLSTFFWMIVLLFYIHYARCPSFYRYILAFLCFVAGLMTKPMLVTLPFVLLLMDYWPLDRFGLTRPSSVDNDGFAERTGSSRFRRFSVFKLILEKIPFLVVAALSVLVSLASLQGPGNITSADSVPIVLRIENALASYVKYLIKLFWPVDMAVYYPYPQSIPVWQWLGALGLLAFISIWVVRNLRQKPYLFSGWCWYLGTLVPVIGLVQASLWPAMADRFAYVPFVGIFIMLAWGVPQVFIHWRHRRFGFTVLAAAFLASLTIVAWVQVGKWASSFTLFEHALAVTDDNHVAHNNLGVALEEKGMIDKAADHFRAALAIKPDYAEAHNNLGFVLATKGRTIEAISHYSMAIRLNPYFAKAHLNLGNALLDQDRTVEAIGHYKAALSIDPAYNEALNNLGVVLILANRFHEAVRYYTYILKIIPDYAEAHYNLAIAMHTLGRIPEAAKHYKEALRHDSDHTKAQHQLERMFNEQEEYKNLNKTE